MKYIKEGNVYETPIYATIDGVNVELSHSQLIGLGYSSADEYISEIQNNIAETTREQSVNSIIIKAIDIQIPQGGSRESNLIKLPFKLGYKWNPVFNNGRISFEMVKDDNAIGTDTNPIIFIEGYDNPLIPNAFYLYNGDTYVYVGPETTSGTNWENVSSDMEKM